MTMNKKKIENANNLRICAYFVIGIGLLASVISFFSTVASYGGEALAMAFVYAIALAFASVVLYLGMIVMADISDSLAGGDEKAAPLKEKEPAK